MKRAICILMTVIICMMGCMPGLVYAETYHPGETDLHIQVDDSTWYVFTRDNIKDNPELDELGLTYDTMYDIFYDNEAYMDAILFYDDGNYVELLVRKRTLDTGIVNLSNYEESDVLELAKELAKKQGAETYSVYENQYKFAQLEYIDSNLGYHIYEFVTCVNKDNYTFTFQSPSPYVDAEYDEIKTVIDSIRFDVDLSLKEPEPPSFWGTVLITTVGGAIIGGIAGAVIALISKKKKNDSKRDKDSHQDMTTPQ